MVDAYVDKLTSKEDFFDAIVKERAWEFGGEKHRRYDLARWNLYGKTLYNLYFDWITLGKVARTKQYENTTTAFGCVCVRNRLMMNVLNLIRQLLITKWSMP